jgi:hypothetical protein
MAKVSGPPVCVDNKALINFSPEFIVILNLFQDNTSRLAILKQVQDDELG